jgi:hypothetical protein
MAWEPRCRDFYYYTVRRQGMQVTKEYLGRGIAAALIAAFLLKQKEHRQALWQKRETLVQSLQETNRRVRAFLKFSSKVERLLRFIEKEAQQGNLEAQDKDPMRICPADPVLPMSIKEILSRVKQGDDEVLRVQRSQEPRLRRQLSNLAQEAQKAQLSAIAEDEPVLKEAIRVQYEVLKQELLGDIRNPLEIFVIERILISWLQAQHIDLLLAKTPASDTRITKLLEHRTTQCQRRLHWAVNQLQALRNPTLAKDKKGRSKAAQSTAEEKEQILALRK